MGSDDVRHALVLGGIAWNRMIHVDHFPDPVPATIFPNRSIEAVGSSGAGKAMNLASLGWNVTFWTPVGDDVAGDRAVAEVAERGVDVVRFPDPEGTSEHVNLMDSDGERISIFARSGSRSLDVPVGELGALMSAADLISITQYDYCRPLLAMGKRSRAPLVIDIHDYDGVNPYHTEFIEAADWLFLSSLSLPDWRGFMEDRAAAGTQIVVATHGSRGATALVDGRFHTCPAVPVDSIVDTNGAGDAFSVAFIDNWMTTGDPDAALAAGAGHAALAIQSDHLAP